MSKKADLRADDPAFQLALWIVWDFQRENYRLPDERHPKLPLAVERCWTGEIHPKRSVVELWGHKLARAVIGIDDDPQFFSRLGRWAACIKRMGRMERLVLCGSDFGIHLQLPSDAPVEQKIVSAHFQIIKSLKRKPTIKMLEEAADTNERTVRRICNALGLQLFSKTGKPLKTGAKKRT